MNNKELRISIIVKLIAIISGIYGLINTFYGFISYTYFTTLSNVFMLFMLVIFLIKDLSKTKKKQVPNILYVIKFLATISISLTFFVFLFILAPANPNGFVASYKLYNYGSLCLHFITPLFSILDFFLFDFKYESKKVHSMYATVPPLAYILYVVVLNGFGMKWKGMSAPYNFLNYSSKTGWFGFNPSLYGEKCLGIGVFYTIVILLILFIFLGILFLNIKDKINKKKSKKT